MYKRLSIVMFPFLLLALIGTGVWGYLEHQEKNTVLMKAENQYQRAFHDLSFHMDKLHSELGNTLAVNSTSQDAYKKGLINVWRITSQAQNEISQLPLTMLPFSKTEDFLSRISNFSYRAAVRDLGKQPLDEQELKTLNVLYKHSTEISKDLRNVQTKVLQNNLRWMDVELALASSKEPHDNAIIDGFSSMDKKVSEYPEINWSPAVMSMYQKRDINMLSGPEVSAEDVKQKAAQFLGIQDASKLQVVENGAGTEYHSFSVSAPRDGSQDGIYMDFSTKGGQLLSFSATRDVPEKKLDLRQARDIAAQFLDEHNYKDMTAVSYDEYNNIANLTFAARTNDDVINYLEKVAVRVALDNGEVTGLEATDYVFDKKDRQLPAPKLTNEEALKTLSPNFQVTSVNKALIRNDIEEEVLCYQYIGNVNGGKYRVYINADSGAEEKIDQIGQQEAAVSQ
ncbi:MULTISPECIES: germination protein YpeB [unclassified Paenibacillus]|uniref:germination protein YpeB n=1 Tax=unclassified Paenibacillus TaxID=185978 RepID=UPI001AE44BF9|nr:MULTISPECIES: germination protein YpeB [unclassified Paenibacillus]MBP1155236.1 spore germination protein [Paenibacillus sp. PvP091]MBP1169380.1 spore germination protein [Paenibacillus sp. PvR098]MBP2440408.1 spore germination protein [Paenibacillus sp. PvP052]